MKYTIEAHYVDTENGREYAFQVIDKDGEVVHWFPVDYDLSEYIVEI